MWRLKCNRYDIVPVRTLSYPHTALSKILNRIVGKYYNILFDITHYFSSNVGFTNIVSRSLGQSGSEDKVQSANCAKTIIFMKQCCRLMHKT